MSFLNTGEVILSLMILEFGWLWCSSRGIRQLIVIANFAWGGSKWRNRFTTVLYILHFIDCGNEGMCLLVFSVDTRVFSFDEFNSYVGGSINVLSVLSGNIFVTGIFNVQQLVSVSSVCVTLYGTWLRVYLIKVVLSYCTHTGYLFCFVSALSLSNSQALKIILHTCDTLLLWSCLHKKNVL